MIKAIFFDFDGVLTTDPTGSVSITNYLAAKAGISVEHIRKCYLPYNQQLLTGKTLP